MEVVIPNNNLLSFFFWFLCFWVVGKRGCDLFLKIEVPRKENKKADISISLFLGFAGGLWWAHRMVFSMGLLLFPRMVCPSQSPSNHSHSHSHRENKISAKIYSLLHSLTLIQSFKQETKVTVSSIEISLFSQPIYRHSHQEILMLNTQKRETKKITVQHSHESVLLLTPQVKF